MRVVGARPLLEVLEDRQLLATWINSKAVSFQDVDGDQVLMQFAQPMFNSASQASQALQFNQGSVNNNNGLPQQLQSMKLSSYPGLANQSITFNVIPGGAGDGKVDVGFIDLGTNSINSIIVPGDVGRFRLGQYQFSSQSMTSLIHVGSMGKRGLSTQAAGGSLDSIMYGKIDEFIVDGDIQDAYLYFSGYSQTVGASPRSDGTPGITPYPIIVNQLQIGGNLIGGDAATAGRIQLLGTLDTLRVSGDIVGGAGDISGKVVAYGINNAAIGGSVIGGSGRQSGQILTGEGTRLNIGGDVRSGSGSESGYVYYAKVDRVEIEGNLDGSTAGGLGVLGVSEVRSLLIKGDLIGGQRELSGGIIINRISGPAVIHGNLLGGTGTGSGSFVADERFVSENQSQGSLKVHGSLIGNGYSSGRIYFSGSPAFVHVGGEVRGSPRTTDGIILGNGSKEVIVEGSITDSLISAKSIDYFQSGSLVNSTVGVEGRLKKFLIKGNIDGSSESLSLFHPAALIQANRIDVGVVNGSLIGGKLLLSGSIISVGGDLGRINIRGDVLGGSGIRSGFIGNEPGYLANIQQLTIQGSLRSGSGPDSGAISATLSIGQLTIGGDVVGTAENPVFIRAAGQVNVPPNAPWPYNNYLGLQGSTLYAMRTCVIQGNVSYTHFRFGEDSLGYNNPRAFVGSMTVGKNWIASNLLVGAVNVNDHRQNFSAIQQLTIKGNVLADANSADNYFIRANWIGRTMINGKVIPLRPGISNDSIKLSNKVFLIESIVIS